jgi:hypothetical protein
MRLAVFFLVLLAMVSVASGDSIRLSSGTFDPLLSPLSIPQNMRAEAPRIGKGYYLLQFKSFPQRAWIKELSKVAIFHEYYPENAYLIEALPSEISAIQSHPSVRWVGLYQPYFKLSPEIGKRSLSPSRRVNGKYFLVVELFPGADTNSAVSAIEKLGGSVLRVFRNSRSTRLKIWFPSSLLANLAALQGVQWIEEEGERTIRNNVTRWVIQSNITNDTSIWDHGIHGEGQIIGHIDGLINNTSCYFAQPGKIVAIHNQSGSIVDSTHGFYTAGIAVGDKETFLLADAFDGNAFAAKIAHTNLCDLDPDDCAGDGKGLGLVTLEKALTNDHNDGARLHTNSWGDDGTTAYTVDCRDIDRFSHEHEDDLVIFAVAPPPFITTPENAKNVLAVGASHQAPNQENDCMTGAGPTDDGRRKPEIYAPGCDIIAANSSACGTDSLSGATSLAAPAIAAAAAMVRQYYREGWYPSGAKTAADGFTPSGALIKATLLNGTVDMTGVPGYPSDQEGWGRLLLDNALFFNGDAQKLIVVDVRNSSGFPTGSNASDTYAFTIATGQPLKVTLVWTDPASPVAAQGSLLNNLNLEVTLPNGNFKGNFFSGGQSAAGGNFDTKNNVEQVVVASPNAGNLTVKVHSAGIGNGPQGYALVITGDVSSLPFFDDFGDGSASDWMLDGKGSGVVNGINQFVLTGSKKITAIPPSSFAGCDDCTLSFDITVDSGKAYIFFPFEDKDSFRQFRFYANKDKVILKENVNGITRKIKFPLTTVPGQPHHVEIENNGGTVSVTIDGTPFAPQNLHNFGPATFKIQSKAGTTHFDNILVQ